MANKTWESLPESPALKRGIFLDVVGLEGAGKSSFALTAPGKIAYVDIDQSVDRAKKPAKKEVRALRVQYHIGLGMDKDKIQKECTAAWDGMERDLLPAINSKGWADSVVIDTGTEGWELRRFASFGTLTPRARRMDRLYGPVNAKYRQFLRSVYREHNRNLITIHQLFDEYTDKMKDGELQSVRTGRKTPKQFKEIDYMYDVRVRVFREGREFKYEIVTCKLPPNGPDLEGTVLDMEDNAFAQVVSLATETEVERWV